MFSDIRRYNAICFDGLYVFLVVKCSMSLLYQRPCWKFRMSTCYLLWTLTLAFDTVIVYVCIHDNVIFAFLFTTLTLYSAIMHLIIRIYHHIIMHASSHSPSSTFSNRRVVHYISHLTLFLLNFCISYFLYVTYDFLLRRRVSVGSVASMLRWVTLALACAMLLTIVSLDSGTA